MQQTINSYNLYKVPSTNADIAATTGSAQFVIGSGVYDLDGSSVEVIFKGVSTAANGNVVHCRADFCPLVQSATIVTIDGVQRAQYLNLAAAQIAYAQDQMYFQGERLDTAVVAATGQSLTKKLWSSLGQGAVAGTGSTTFSKAYQLKHFFPGMWNDGDKYFAVNSVANITMNTAISALADCLSEQAVANTPNGALIATNGGQITTAPTGIQFIINLKRVTNQVEQAQASIQPHITCYLQQAQPVGNGVTFNQTFGANQISAKQYMSLLQGTAVNTQFLFDEYLFPGAGQIAANQTGIMNIQRAGVNIISSSNQSNLQDAIAQLQLVKSVHKPDYRNLIVCFDTIFSNCNLQTQITYSGYVQTTVPLTCYLGYSYIMQVM